VKGMKIQKLISLLIVFLTAAPCFGTVFKGNSRTLLPADHPVRNFVGRLYLRGHRICTGSLVGPNVLLTSAHCFVDKDHKLESGEFKAGYSQGNSVAQSKVLVNRLKLGTFFTIENQANDWAVAILESPIGLTTGWFEIKPVSALEMAVMKWDGLHMATYAIDLWGGEAPLIENCKFTGSILWP
jgi:hypothetical protein